MKKMRAVTGSLVLTFILVLGVFQADAKPTKEAMFEETTAGISGKCSVARRSGGLTARFTIKGAQQYAGSGVTFDLTDETGSLYQFANGTIGANGRARGSVTDTDIFSFQEGDPLVCKAFISGVGLVSQSNIFSAP